MLSRLRLRRWGMGGNDAETAYLTGVVCCLGMKYIGEAPVSPYKRDGKWYYISPFFHRENEVLNLAVIEELEKAENQPHHQDVNSPVLAPSGGALRS